MLSKSSRTAQRKTHVEWNRDRVLPYLLTDSIVTLPAYTTFRSEASIG
jgi:hypothetical protein